MAVLMENISCGIQMIQRTTTTTNSGQYESFILLYITEDDGGYRFECTNINFYLDPPSLYTSTTAGRCSILFDFHKTYSFFFVLWKSTFSSYFSS